MFALRISKNFLANLTEIFLGLKVKLLKKNVGYNIF